MKWIDKIKNMDIDEMANFFILQKQVAVVVLH